VNRNLSRNAFNESLLGLLDKIYKEDSTTSSILQVLDLSHNHIWGDASELNYLVKAIGSQGLFTLVTKGRDQSFSCIVIGGKVGAGPSSLYTIKSDQGLQWMKK
jgi:hypothetical protein